MKNNDIFRKYIIIICQAFFLLAILIAARLLYLKYYCSSKYTINEFNAFFVFFVGLISIFILNRLKR